MQSDIWKFSALLLIAGLLGFMAGHTLLAMLVMSISIIGWQIYRLNLLYRWMINPRKNPMPETSGQSYLLHRESNRRNLKNQQRKRQLSTMLTQFRQAVGALPDAIVLINDNGKIEWANSNSKTVLGIRWPEDMAVRFSDLIRYPEVETILNNDSPSEQGIIVNSYLNSGQTISIKCVHYTDELRMIIARDISKIIKVNQLHTDFVANVSHELKTPLTVLRGYLEIMQDNKELPKKFHKPFEQMSVQSARMQFIVNDLLYLAKLENDDTSSAQEPIDITHVVNTIIEAVQPLIEDKHHKIELDIDYSVHVIGAQTELHSAFSNLITNAIHYTPKHGSIHIRWFVEGNNAVFAVKDNGEGISAHHIERLTQRFFRVDTDRSRESGGTGLGLAIVKHVLQRHHAELDISSKIGVGSEFRCLFPITQLKEAPVPQENHDIGAEAE